MTILQSIKSICEQIPAYSFQFDEKKMFNITADNQVFPCVFFEEYTEGNYRTQYFFEKTTRVQLYFCKLSQMNNEAEEREQIRDEIETEAVKPFIQLYNKSTGLFKPITEWKFFTPPPRFDANEVSVMLQFDAQKIGTC